MPTFKLVRRPRCKAGSSGDKHAREVDEAVAASVSAVPDAVASDAVTATVAVPDPAVSSDAVAALPAVSAQPHADADCGARKKRKVNKPKETAAATMASASQVKPPTGTSNGTPQMREERNAQAASNQVYMQMLHAAQFAQLAQMQQACAYSQGAAMAAYTSALMATYAPATKRGTKRKPNNYDHMLKQARLAADNPSQFIAQQHASLPSVLFPVQFPAQQDLPTGVYKMQSKISPKKFSALIHWGGKTRYIGSFNTPEQASAAYVSVLSASTTGGDDASFYSSQKKAVEAEGGIILHKTTSKASSVCDLPGGVKRNENGQRFVSRIWWADTNRYIGTFDTPEQASIAYLSVKEDLAGIKPSAIGADNGNSLFDAARKKAKEAARQKGKEEEAAVGVLV